MMDKPVGSIDVLREVSPTTSLKRARLGLAWRRYKRLTPGGLILLPFLLFALFPRAFSAYDPLKISVKNTFEPPGASHWFGTDELGRDVFSRVVHGTRISLTASLMTIAFASVIGVVLGVVAGYREGWAD